MQVLQEQKPVQFAIPLAILVILPSMASTHHELSKPVRLWQVADDCCQTTSRDERPLNLRLGGDTSLIRFRFG